MKIKQINLEKEKQIVCRKFSNRIKIFILTRYILIFERVKDTRHNAIINGAFSYVTNTAIKHEVS